MQSELVEKGRSVGEDDSMLESDLLWGVRPISRTINRTERQTFHLLESGLLPATKIGGRWCTSRTRLKEFFSDAIAREVA